MVRTFTQSHNSYRHFIKSFLPPGIPLMVHSAFSNIRRAFSSLTIEEMIEALQERLSPEGSLIMPAFTYCFKRRDGSHDIFDRNHSQSKVGAVTEVFRNKPGVVRTSSATHSFALWGKVTRHIPYRNSPDSPLGEGSVLAWLTQQPEAHILLLGVDFSCLSYCHYLETIAPVPWANFSPWGYMGVESIGVSTHGEQPLRQVPGCARSFVHFERYLLRKKVIRRLVFGPLGYYMLPVALLYQHGLSYFRRFPLRLLCPPRTCPACDARRADYATHF
ncbi:AAC(3) family N-acetyltransferase [candidate division KSB1 bacterium]|nr:AAC(3) family N-acetyltransferase [candidate division KSB1 bacterium]